MENKNAPFKRNSSLVKQRRMTEGWIPAFAGMTEEESGMADEDFTLTPPSPLKGENSIEYRVYSEKEIRYKNRLQVAGCEFLKTRYKIREILPSVDRLSVYSLQLIKNTREKRCEIKKVDLFLRYFLSPLLKAFVALYEGGL